MTDFNYTNYPRERAAHEGAQGVTAGTTLPKASTAIILSAAATLGTVIFADGSGVTLASLSAGVLYPFAISSIGSISAGTVTAFF
jgi:hypothetical protein